MTFMGVPQCPAGLVWQPGDVAVLVLAALCAVFVVVLLYAALLGPAPDRYAQLPTILPRCGGETMTTHKPTDPADKAGAAAEQEVNND